MGDVGALARQSLIQGLRGFASRSSGSSGAWRCRALLRCGVQPDPAGAAGVADPAVPPEPDGSDKRRRSTWNNLPNNAGPLWCPAAPLARRHATPRARLDVFGPQYCHTWSASPAAFLRAEPGSRAACRASYAVRAAARPALVHKHPWARRSCASSEQKGSAQNRLGHGRGRPDQWSVGAGGFTPLPKERKQPMDSPPHQLHRDLFCTREKWERYAGQLAARVDWDGVYTYAAELYRWSARMSLIAPSDRDALGSRHILRALAPLPLLLALPHGSIADVGSGAGLPGIPLALALPDARLFLIESRRRRVSFLRHMKRLLALDHLQVIHCRVEDCPLGDATVDCIITRAVAPDAGLVAATSRLLCPHGTILHYVDSRRPRPPRASLLWRGRTGPDCDFPVMEGNVRTDLPQ